MKTGNRSQRRSPPQSKHPYLDWAIQTNFAYLRAGRWLPLLVEFNPAALPRVRGKSPLEVFTSLVWLVSTLKSAVRVPELFLNPPNAIRKSRRFNYCVLLIDRNKAAGLVSDPSWTQTIRRAELGPPVSLPPRAPRWPQPVVAQSVGGGSAMTGRVVVAVIDEGIAFANSRFATAAGTRIEYLWQQDVIGAGGWFASPGRELTSASINAALQAIRLMGGDEDLAYRTAGSLDFSVDGFKPLARRRSHGAHVLDLAAGYEPSTANTNRPIIAVDMPEEAVGDPAGSTLGVHAAWGLAYIIARAEALRANNEILPVVVNLSYGPHDGPHDGTTLFEEVADVLTNLFQNTNTPLRVVLAAGNYRQSRVHALFQVRRKGQTALQWRLQPGGLTPSFLEIWLPPNTGAQVSVTLRSPTGQTVSVNPTQPPNWWPNANNIEMGAQFVSPANNTARPGFLLTVARTAVDPSIPGSQPVAPSGLWTVVVTNPSATSLTMDAWIRRSDTPSGRRAKGRQSYFDDPADQRFRVQAPAVPPLPPSATRPLEFNLPNAGYVRRRGTLSGIATGTTTFVVGGYRHDGHHPAPYSSQSPHANAQRAMNAPTCLFPSDDSIACHGLLAAGTRSGSTVAMNGTSVAAPQAARWVANQWATNGAVPIPPFPGRFTATPNPFNPIPPPDLPLVGGNDLMPTTVPPPRYRQPRR